jgi:hypothetical protein
VGRRWTPAILRSPSFGMRETARLLSVLLPVIDREPLFYIEEGTVAEGYPLVAAYGEQGPKVAGWLDRSGPRGYIFWRRSSAPRSRLCSRRPGPGPKSKSGASAPRISGCREDTAEGRERQGAAASVPQKRKYCTAEDIGNTSDRRHR